MEVCARLWIKYTVDLSSDIDAATWWIGANVARKRAIVLSNARKFSLKLVDEGCPVRGSASGRAAGRSYLRGFQLDESFCEPSNKAAAFACSAAVEKPPTRGEACAWCMKNAVMTGDPVPRSSSPWKA